MKIVSYLKQAFVMGIARIPGGVGLGVFPTPKPPEGSGRKIHCPFLAMDPPDTSNIRTFAQSCAANGQSYSMAVLIGSNVTYQQRGLMALLRQEAPDIYRLDEVPTVSHEDLFQLFIPELREMAEASAVDGQITLQDIVEMKEWVAVQTGVIPNEASRAETALLFVKSGGDMESWTVDMDRVFRMMAGQRPGIDADVTPENLKQVLDNTVWRL